MQSQWLHNSEKEEISNNKEAGTSHMSLLRYATHCDQMFTDDLDTLKWQVYQWPRTPILNVCFLLPGGSSRVLAYLHANCLAYLDLLIS